MIAAEKSRIRKQIGYPSRAHILALVLTLLLGLKVSAQCSSSDDEMGALGIMNFKGEWIVPPQYEQIVYNKKINCYWVRQKNGSRRKSGALTDLLGLFIRNTSWKLLDSNGKELDSSLAFMNEIADESDCALSFRLFPNNIPLPPGVTVYSSLMEISNGKGRGLCDPQGNQVTPCIYCEMYDVGEGLYLAREPYQYPLLDRLFPGIITTVGGCFAEYPQPPFVLLNHEGKQIAALPDDVYLVQSGYIDGLLYCYAKCPGQRVKAFDRTGKLVYSSSSDSFNPFLKAHPAEDLYSSHLYVYKRPSNTLQPVKFQKESDVKNPAAPHWACPIETDNKHIGVIGARIKPGQEYLAGLVDDHGNWLLQPKYDRLGYCTPDRIIASQDHLTERQQQMRRWKYFGTR